VTFVDSNVFVIDLRYPRDPLRPANNRFLRTLRERGDGATTLINLLEVAGILAHNLNPRQLRELLAHFPARYGIRVFPPLEGTAALPAIPVAEIAALLGRRLAFGDALVLHQVERYALPGSRFVTWDAHHFRKATTLPVLTPLEALNQK
jgi:predicted nucleic acid-binding protein